MADLKKTRKKEDTWDVLQLPLLDGRKHGNTQMKKTVQEE